LIQVKQHCIEFSRAEELIGQINTPSFNSNANLNTPIALLQLLSEQKELALAGNNQMLEDPKVCVVVASST
jgi:hypothetical protein